MNGHIVCSQMLTRSVSVRASIGHIRKLPKDSTKRANIHTLISFALSSPPMPSQRKTARGEIILCPNGSHVQIFPQGLAHSIRLVAYRTHRLSLVTSPNTCLRTACRKSGRRIGAGCVTRIIGRRSLNSRLILYEFCAHLRTGKRYPTREVFSHVRHLSSMNWRVTT